MTPLKTYEVTGELNPDVTGIYEDAGEYEGKRSYELVGNGWFLWYSEDDWWYITPERGTVTGKYWVRLDPAIEGDYNPIGTATGIAAVTEI